MMLSILVCVHCPLCTLGEVFRSFAYFLIGFFVFITELSVLLCGSSSHTGVEWDLSRDLSGAAYLPGCL